MHSRAHRSCGIYHATARATDAYPMLVLVRSRRGRTYFRIVGPLAPQNKLKADGMRPMEVYRVLA